MPFIFIYKTVLMIYVRKISYHFNNFPFFPLESQLWIWVNTRIYKGRIDGDSYYTANVLSAEFTDE